MATTILRTGLRFVASNGFLERRTTFALYNGAMQVVKNNDLTSPKYQYHEIARRMYSKRSVHHTGISTSTNNHEDSDSDSDNEEKGESHFWRRKMRTLHNHLDVNKDGVVSYDDFMLLADRFSNLGHLSPAAKVEFKNVLNEMWEEQWGEISPYNLICVEKYLEEMHHVLNDSSLTKKCHHFLPFLFRAVDKDQSGEISVVEFKIFFQCLGLTHDVSNTIFIEACRTEFNQTN